MSGTKEKTTGQQIAKGRAVKVSAPEVASTDAPDLPGAERPVTLPGHYIAVGAAPVSVVPDEAGSLQPPDSGIALSGDNISITAPAISISAENLTTIRDGSDTSLTKEGMEKMHDSVMSAANNVEVLEVRARSERGFFRCGHFWPRDPVHVFVSDDPEGDNEASARDDDVVMVCFISHETAERLKSEPHLVVTALQTVAEKD